MKMVKSGKLKTLLEEVDGKEVIYILLDEETEEEIKKAIVPLSERESVAIREELKALRAEIRILKEEIILIKEKNIIMK
jgi:polyhydroxyalkanoate synthesis regulator phasin